jgi:outer membrane protein assembly factor BamB
MRSHRKSILLNQFLLMLILFSTTLFAQGEKLWSLKMAGQNIDASAAIGDVDRDGHLDIVVGSTIGNVIALDGYGREIWRVDLKDPISIAPTVADVTGDPGLEVLVLTMSGEIYCLDGLTADLLWQDHTLGKIKWASMTVIAADINSDGKKEIIAADEEGTLVCLAGDGKKVWQYNEMEGIGSAPAVGDIDGDGMAEIVIASEESPIICLNHKGEEQWRFKPQGDILSSGRKREVAAPVIWDINKSGKFEIVTGMGYELGAVDSDGKLVWSFPMKNRIDSAISIADADGNGEVEIYAVDLSGTMVCVKADGKAKWSAKLGGRARRSPTIADIDGDGTVEIITAGYSNKMQIFNPAGDIDEEIMIKGGTNAAATVADLLGDGGLCAVVPEISGNLVVYRWEPVIKNPEILWPEYRAWASRSAGEFSQNKSDDKTIIDKRAFHVGRQDLIDNLSELKKTQNELQKLTLLLGDDKGMVERVYYLNAEIKHIQNQLENIDNLAPIKKRELRDKLVELKTELFRLLKIAEQAVENEQIIAIYAANPWVPFGDMDEIVEGRTPEAKLTIEAFQGEFESAALNVFNFSGSARTVLVDIEKLSGPPGAAPVSTDDLFTLCETIEVPTQDADLSSDALPELNGGNLLTIPAWGGRQLWLTLNTQQLTPGTWTAKILLKSLEVEPLLAEAELTIKIWDVPFPKDQPLKLCHWGFTENPKGALADQIAHGTNVFPRTVPAKADFDELGKIENIDYSDHDDFMTRHAPHGTILFHSLVSLKGTAPPFSTPWLKAYSSFLPLWIKHLKELGFGYEIFAFYPVDEPGLEHGKNVSRFMKWAKLVRKIDPKIRIYANPVAQITMEQLEEMEPFVDIWTPMQTNIFPQEKLDFIHSTKTIWWNYDPSDNAKHLSPLAYYRGQAWMSWHNGHTGIGFWTYSGGKDFWFQPKSGFEYALTYEGKGVVTSKRWEAVRDGVEDYSLLNALKKETSAAKKVGGNEDLVKKSQRMLEEKPALITEFMKNNKPGRAGQDVARKIADERWNTFRQTRAEIAELLSQFNDK